MIYKSYDMYESNLNSSGIYDEISDKFKRKSIIIDSKNMTLLWNGKEKKTNLVEIGYLVNWEGKGKTYRGNKLILKKENSWIGSDDTVIWTKPGIEWSLTTTAEKTQKI